jgi:quinol monooxygenase YgiN
MHIVHVSVHVNLDAIDAFTSATLDNARHSMQEPGVVRFDVLQQPDDPSRFLLVECYRTPADQLAHRETAHYLRWRDAVAPMMASPRAATKFAAVYWSAGFAEEER